MVPASNGGQECEGDAFEEESCNSNDCPVDCQWDDYGDWSVCSSTCGEGKMVRYRAVLFPASNGGIECLGDAKEIKECNEGPCKGKTLFTILISNFLIK